MASKMDLIRERHSVRQFLDKVIPDDIRKQLDDYAEKLNQDGGLHMQIIYDEPACFSTRMAHYGSFENCKNYIVMAGKKAADLDERCGFYGELLVLKAQELGLNTCWTALTHGKSKAVIEADEKEVIVIALGYGKTQGIEHKSKKLSDVSNVSADAPVWFKRGVKAAFERKGDTVTAKAGKIGPCLKIDLGIVKCHFEIGAGKDNFTWG